MWDASCWLYGKAQVVELRLLLRAAKVLLRLVMDLLGADNYFLLGSTCGGVAAGGNFFWDLQLLLLGIGSRRVAPSTAQKTRALGRTWQVGGWEGNGGERADAECWMATDTIGKPGTRRGMQVHG